MKIKLDENLSRQLKLPLEQHGHDVGTVAEEGLLGQADVVVGAAARAEGRMVYTLDVGFADLRKFPPGQHPGIILFRPRSTGPLAVQAFVLQFTHATNLDELLGCVVVVEPKRIRIRRPPPESKPLEE